MAQKNRPIFSVITVVFNAVQDLEKTLLSVVAQDFEGLEYIVIDGGSKDGTVDVIQRYEKHVTRWSSEPDRGIYDAMNKGVLRANGQFLNFMNAGDIFADKDVLRDIAEGLDAERDMIVSGDTRISYGEGCRRLLTACLRRHDMPTCHQAMFINREVFLHHGLYDTRYRFCADFDLYQKVLVGSPSGLRVVRRVVSENNLNGVSNTYWLKVWLERIAIARRQLPFWRFLGSLSFRLVEGARLVMVRSLQAAGIYRLIIAWRCRAANGASTKGAIKMPSK